MSVAAKLTFDIVWVEDSIASTVTINCSRKEQYDQWMRTLFLWIPDDAFPSNMEDDAMGVPDVDDPLNQGIYIHCDNQCRDLTIPEEMVISRKTHRPKSWSIVARRNMSVSSLARSGEDDTFRSPLSSPFFAEDSMRNARTPLHVQVSFVSHIPADPEPELKSTSSVGSDGASVQLNRRYLTMYSPIVLGFGQTSKMTSPTFLASLSSAMSIRLHMEDSQTFGNVIGRPKLGSGR